MNGVKGSEFISNKNGNSIFLPAAGERYYDFLSGVGSAGNYWSSSLYSGCPYNAYTIDLVGSDYMSTGYCIRCWGLSVRPVSE